MAGVVVAAVAIAVATMVAVAAAGLEAFCCCFCWTRGGEVGCSCIGQVTGTDSQSAEPGNGMQALHEFT